MKPVRIAALLLMGLVCLIGATSVSRAETDEERRWEKLRNERWGQTNPMPQFARDNYGAIAYSPSTGRVGSSWNYRTLGDAQRAAVTACKAPDGQPVTWARNGFYCALAVGADGSLGTGYGSTPARAKAIALRDCRKYTADCKIVTCIYAGD
jgi:Domain of unknown function (DUF4189)